MRRIKFEGSLRRRLSASLAAAAVAVTMVATSVVGASAEDATDPAPAVVETAVLVDSAPADVEQAAEPADPAPPAEEAEDVFVPVEAVELVGPAPAEVAEEAVVQTPAVDPVITVVEEPVAALAAEPIERDYTYACSVNGGTYTVTYSPIFNPGTSGAYVMLQPSGEGGTQDTALPFENANTITFTLAQFANTTVESQGVIGIKTFYPGEGEGPEYTGPDLLVDLSTCTDLTPPPLTEVTAVNGTFVDEPGPDFNLKFVPVPTEGVEYVVVRVENTNTLNVTAVAKTGNVLANPEWFQTATDLLVTETTATPTPDPTPTVDPKPSAKPKPSLPAKPGPVAKPTPSSTASPTTSTSSSVTITASASAAASVADQSSNPGLPEAGAEGDSFFDNLAFAAMMALLLVVALVIAEFGRRRQ